MRRMKPNHRSGCPSHFIAFDTETIEVPHPTRLGAIVNTFRFAWVCSFRIDGGHRTREHWRRFGEPEALWEWVRGKLEPSKRTLLVSHWAGYDLTAARLWAEMEAGRFMPRTRLREAPRQKTAEEEGSELSSMLVLDDPPTILDLVTRDGRGLVACDLMNWFPVKLETIGHALGIPKLPFPGEQSDEAYWDAYCRRDVEIVVAALTELYRLIKTEDLGNWSYTTAGQSLNFYRHRGMKGLLTWGHDETWKTLEREAYCGGRCRSYFLGSVGLPVPAPEECTTLFARDEALARAPCVYRLDVNACYPSVMRGNDYPVQYLNCHNNPTLAETETYLRVHEAVASVRLRRATEPFPYKDGGRWRHCLGTFDTTLCGPDLRRALAGGWIERVYRLQTYIRGRPFDAFVDLCEEMRGRFGDAGMPLHADMVKRLANALHGKFGQWSGGWKDDADILPAVMWGTFTEIDTSTGLVVTYRSLAGFVQRKEQRHEKRNNFPLISAYVTAYARAHMDRMVAVAGQRERFYEDSDSLHVGSAGYERLCRAGQVDSVQWGKLKVEQSARHAIYRGPKNYCLDGVWTIAGVPKNAEKDTKGFFHRRDLLSLQSLLNGPVPDGPVSRTVEIPEPSPTIDGRIGVDGYLDWPIEGG